MISSIEEKQFIEKRINKLENILIDLKERLLPDREEQYNAMAAVYVRKIIELREMIEEYTGMNNLLINKDDINIHINGPSIGYGKVPISVLSAYLDSLKTSVRGNYRILYNRSKVPQNIAMLTDFTLNQLAAGSINLSLGIPNEQISFLGDMSLENSLNIYFDLLNAISKQDEEYVIPGIDEDTMGKLLSNILKVIPDDKNIKSVEVYGFRVKARERICLNHESRKFILKKIDGINEKEKNIIVTGIIRELDLDKLTFCLRDIDIQGKNQIKCDVSKEQVNDLGEYLNSYVKVTGVLDGNTVKVKYISKE